jgi:benzylsuccinate CoA-transferase BbsF subunit
VSDPCLNHENDIHVLDGIKVVDFSWGIVGPVITKYLADQGAKVVCIESPDRPPVVRTTGPFTDKTSGVNRSGYFAFFNANKCSVGINLGHPKGTEVAKKLVSWADIVVESFTPGVMERFGLGYDNLRLIKPDIIMLRTTAAGQNGPHAQMRGLGFQLVGMSGFITITGWPDRDPVAPFGAYTDLIAPRFGAIALLDRLVHRRKTGEGALIDLSQVESGTYFLEPLIIDSVVNKREFLRKGNACEYAAPHGVYPTQKKDEWCAIAVYSDQEWKNLCEAIGHLDWMSNPKFLSFKDRKRNEVELNKYLAEWTAKYFALDVMELMQAKGIRCGVVQNPRNLLYDSQLLHRDYFWFFEHPEMGTTLHLGQPFVLSKVQPLKRSAAPCLGEHTFHICKDFLNFSDEEIAALMAEEAIY